MRQIQSCHPNSRIWSLGLFMWDLVRDCMYQMPYVNMQELKHRAAAAIHSIAPQMLANKGVKSSIAWTYNTQPRDLASIFMNFCSSIITSPTSSLAIRECESKDEIIIDAMGGGQYNSNRNSGRQVLSVAPNGGSADNRLMRRRDEH
ncbi:hypothetical protein AVEN_66833-1 [Araneus ventricosus]|uniref:Uncharacterized protein n=1 Tax=Araneus ventricosus TaxID=182803 RepID=A0A4Y2DRT8_ARAVE|nr:hypothetical protein AVEN_66833-1 [Araneus ventricosus]